MTEDHPANPSLNGAGDPREPNREELAIADRYSSGIIAAGEKHEAFKVASAIASVSTWARWMLYGGV